MTYCIPNLHPEWSYFDSPSKYLNIVDDYITNNNITATISGAISWNCGLMILGLKDDICNSRISFENEIDLKKFETWFNETPKKSMHELGIGIYISRNYQEKTMT